MEHMHEPIYQASLEVFNQIHCIRIQIQFGKPFVLSISNHPNHDL